MRIKFFILFFFIYVSCFSKSLNVKTFGAIGDGINDDWYGIQKAVNHAFENSYDTLIIPSGKYLISKTLVISGSNLVIIGAKDGESLLEKSGNPGWWGDLMYICGKIPSFKYFDENNNEYYYKGEKVYSTNLVIANLSFKSYSTKNERINNLGIVNSKNVFVKDCSFLESANTNVAIVNDLSKFDNINIRIINCSFDNAKTHNLRVLSMNEGNFVNNTVYVENSVFCRTGVTKNKELSSEKVHIWYRGGKLNTKTALEIRNSYFDDSGVVHSTGNSNDLKIKDSFLGKGYIISNNSKFYPKSKVYVENVETGVYAIKKILGIKND